MLTPEEWEARRVALDEREAELDARAAKLDLRKASIDALDRDHLSRVQKFREALRDFEIEKAGFDRKVNEIERREALLRAT